MVIKKEEIDAILKKAVGSSVVLEKVGSSLVRTFAFSTGIPNLFGMSEADIKSHNKAIDFIAPESRDDMKRAVSKIASDHEEKEFECLISNPKKGNRKIICTLKYLGENEDGNQLLLASAINTEDDLSNNTPGGIFIYSAGEDETFEFVSQNMLDFLGYTREEFETKFDNRFSKMIYEEDRSNTIKSINRQIAKSDFDSCEYRIEKKDGSLVWVHDEGHIITDIYGNKKFYVVIVDDTKNQEELQILTQRNHDLSSVLDSIPIGVITFFKVDGVMKFSDANTYALDKLETTKADILMNKGQGINDRIHPDDSLSYQKFINDFDNGIVNEKIIVRIRPLNSENHLYLSLESSKKEIENGRTYYLISLIDVTEDKRLQGQLINSELKYRNAIRGANLLVWDFDLRKKHVEITTNFTDDNKDFRLMFDNTPESIYEFYEDRDQPILEKMFKTIMSGADNASADAWRKPNGSRTGSRCDRLSCSIVKNKIGEPIFAYGITQDITLQKLEEAKFRDSLESILSANPEALCAFQLNITKNQCSVVNGTSSYAVKTINSDTVDGLFSNIIQMIPRSDDQERCKAFFNRETILKNDANLSDAIEYRRKDENNSTIWAKTLINALKNPETGDIEGVIYTLNITKDKLHDEIFNLITDKEYDFVAILHTDTRKLEILNLSSALLPSYHIVFDKPGHLFDYDGTREFTASRWVASEDREYYLKETTLETVMMELDLHGSYELSIRGHYTGRPNEFMCRKLQHYYLGDGRKNVLVVQSNVTETYLQQMKELESAKANAAQVQNIINLISVGIAIIYMANPNDVKIGFVNKQLYRMMKGSKSPSEIKQEDIENYIKEHADNSLIQVHPDDIDRVRDTFGANFNSDFFIIDNFRIIDEDGKIIWLKEDITYKGEESGHKIFCVVANNVTSEVNLRNEIEKRLKQETELKKRAENASEAKTEFISKMSHDLRTPLTNIIGMTSIAIKQENPTRTSDCLSKIDVSSKYLLDLVNNLLDITRIESGEIILHKEDYCIADFEKFFISVIQPVLESKGQKRELEFVGNGQSYALYIDRILFEQTIFAILSSASEVSPVGSIIKQKVILNATKGKADIDIFITDNSRGRAKEIEAALNNPNWSSEISSKLDASTSLSFSVVKKTIELLGGKIKVIENSDGSTTIELSFITDCIPLSEYMKKQDTKNNENIDKIIAVLQGKHALIFDDNILNQEIAKAILSEAGIVVDAASSGKEGLDLYNKARDGYYDFVLMDIRMPELDGYETAKLIRKSGKPDALIIPIIAMTADAYEKDEKRAFEAGMNGYLTKPIVPNILLGTMAKCLNK